MSETDSESESDDNQPIWKSKTINWKSKTINFLDKMSNVCEGCSGDKILSLSAE